MFRTRDRHDQAVLVSGHERVHDRILAAFFAPVLETDVLRKAHAVPHASVDHVKLIHQSLIEFQARVDLFRECHRVCASDLRVSVILRSIKPHLLHVEICHQRQINELVETVRDVSGKLGIKAFRRAHQLLDRREHLFGFFKRERRIYLVVHGLGAARGRDPGVSEKEILDLLFLRRRKRRSEVFLDEKLRVFMCGILIGSAPFIEIVGEIEEE